LIMSYETARIILNVTTAETKSGGLLIEIMADG